jgi:hypothetical protein
MEARALANDAAGQACVGAGAQLLDGTVVFRSVKPGRNQDGSTCLKRTYVFDYTDDGVARRQGFVVLAGHAVDTVGLGPTLVYTRANSAPGP